MSSTTSRWVGRRARIGLTPAAPYRIFKLNDLRPGYGVGEGDHIVKLRVTNLMLGVDF
jgi:hypothetical protein